MNYQPKQSYHINHSTYCSYCPAFCCCKLPGSTLFIYADDINRIGRHLLISDGEVKRQYLEGKNYLYDTRRWLVHFSRRRFIK
jgi:hypothetical protein